MNMRILVTSTALWAATSVANALVIIGGSTGNGNFSAGGAVPAGAQTYDQTANWFNGGGAESINFTQDEQMNGSSDPDHTVVKRGGMPFQNRLQINDSSYTITTSGEVFSLSYEFGAGGGPSGWLADDTTMQTFLFTSTTPVDGDTIGADITELGGDDYPVDRDDGQWTTRSVPNFYTSTAADIGKTVYFGMQFEDLNGTPLLYPRIDLVQLEVTGGSTNPPPAATTNIIGGAVGNGDFEDGEPAASGAVTYGNTIHWHNASGDETINFSNDSQTGGSSQPNSRAGMPFQNRIQVNDTGYTVVEEGQTFDLSYEFGRVGTGWDGDESMRTFLFTATASVDGSLTPGNMSETGSVTYIFPTNDFWTVFTTNAFYTTTAADVGKTFYFGMEHQNPGGAVVYPRLDLVILDVNASTSPPTNSTPIIIGGVTGNGDFEDGEPAASGAVTYDNTVHWFNAGGADTINFTQDSQTTGSSQPDSRAGMPFQSRKQVNDTGHTVAAEGEVFNLSYDYGRMGVGWDGDESMRTFLFTATAPVDAALTDANMDEFADVVYVFPTNEFWTSFSTNAFYTAGASDVGKTFYFGMEMQNPGGADVFPRIDVIQWDFEEAGSTNPPVLTAWEQFVSDFGLSGDKTADFDNDGQYDYVEFAHGGNPTNPAVTATLPYIETPVGGVISFTSLESSVTNPGVYYNAEWTDDLVIGDWQSMWDAEVENPAAITNFNLVERQLDVSTNDVLFMRNRLSETPGRPNILFILADDLGYADVSFNTTAGVTPEITTPELDTLASSGSIFTSAYVVHPFCGPSRMGLMAGRYPHEFGGPFNLPPTEYLDQGISTNETLFSTMLQSAGYYTGLMGKWHLGEQPEHHPNVRGFDEFYGFLGGGIVYFGPYQSSGWNYLHYPEENGVPDTSLTSSDHITEVLTDKGTNFIHQAAQTEDPFFLYMSYNAPHSVLTYNGNPQARAADMAMFPSLTGNRQIYAGLVYQMDRCIGELVQALKDTGQYENTLIVFLSDNGGREDTIGSGDNGILRGDKGDVTEGGFRVPMFLHWPGVIPTGVTYDHPVTALDFYPTFARLAQTDVPATQATDGKDIWDGVLAGTNARPGDPIYTVAYSTSAASVGIRQDQWKALKLGTNPWTLYNIDSDIAETANLSGAQSMVLSNLVTEGSTWSMDHVQPLWWNNTAAEGTWNSNNMPHYETVFTLP